MQAELVSGRRQVMAYSRDSYCLACRSTSVLSEFIWPLNRLLSENAGWGAGLAGITLYALCK
jgi:hypothetical protein